MKNIVRHTNLQLFKAPIVIFTRLNASKSLTQISYHKHLLQVIVTKSIFIHPHRLRTLEDSLYLIFCSFTHRSSDHFINRIGKGLEMKLFVFAYSNRLLKSTEFRRQKSSFRSKFVFTSFNSRETFSLFECLMRSSTNWLIKLRPWVKESNTSFSTTKPALIIVVIIAIHPFNEIVIKLLIKSL